MSSLQIDWLRSSDAAAGIKAIRASFPMRLTYRAWLERKKYNPGTINARLSNAERVEKHYNCDLDERFDEDRLARLLKELRYSKADKRNDLPNPTKIDINGDIYDGLATLRSALKLYKRFRYDLGNEGDVAKHKRKSAIKTCYTCPDCGLNAWAEPQASLICGECEEPLEADEDAGHD